MTTNKAQGQTIPNSTTWMLAKPNKDLDPTGRRTKNIVFRDILLSSK